jgi:hypothetical protein
VGTCASAKPRGAPLGDGWPCRLASVIGILGQTWEPSRGVVMNGGFCMLKRVVTALLAALIAAATTTPGVVAAEVHQYIRQTGQLPPLAKASTYEVLGVRTEVGCQFEFPFVIRHPGDPHLVQRVIGIDRSRSAYLIEEGEATDFRAGKVAGYFTESIHDAVNFSGVAEGPESVCPPHSTGAAQRIVYGDILGIEVNSDETDISWSYNCSTVYNTRASGYFTWLIATGWSKESSSAQRFNPQSYYFYGKTASTFRNSLFCAPSVVWVWYYSNIVYGYSDGSTGYSSSFDDYSSCAPLFPAVQR